MKKLKGLSHLVIAATAGLSATTAFGYGSGISTFPLEVDKKIISAEPTAILSNGGGLGVQARYTQKLNDLSTFDLGLGISGGERSARIFAGYDYELFPDYDVQPRTSIKAFYENSKEFGLRRNIIGIAPTVSKGYSFWGQEAFPYISLPYGISLDGKENSYETTLSANIGVSGIISPDQMGTDKPITANAEAIIGLKDSFTAVYFGFGYPIE